MTGVQTCALPIFGADHIADLQTRAGVRAADADDYDARRALLLDRERQGVRHVHLSDAGDDGPDAVLQQATFEFGCGGDEQAHSRYSRSLLLSSSTYFVFLVAVFFLYWPLARNRAVALGLILFANYFFYARWDLVYLILIPAASTFDFLVGLGLQKSQRPGVRRLLVTASILMNVALLGFSKYVPFVLENWSEIGRAHV